MRFTVHTGAEYVEVRAGTYFVGDPCYVVPRDEWSPLLDSRGDWANPIGVTPSGFEVLMFATAWGDGVYPSADGQAAFSVDSGVIGLVPIELAARADPGNLGLGAVVTFPFDFVAMRMGGGRLMFGHVLIPTD